MNVSSCPLLRIECAEIGDRGYGPWSEISPGEFVKRTEGAGYIAGGTALLTLHELGELRTPFMAYRVKQGAPA